MFLRATARRKDGKVHRYWSVVGNRRVRGGRTVQKTVVYLGEISDSQRAVWCRTIDALQGEGAVAVSLFPDDRGAFAICPGIKGASRSILCQGTSDALH